jgi:putative transposase
VTDITSIRTFEGFAYLAVVLDLYSHRVVGWSMQSRQAIDVVLLALRLKPARWGRNSAYSSMYRRDFAPVWARQ